MGFPAWASVGAGRGGRGLVWDLPSVPSSTPGQPTGLQTGGRGAGESAPGAESEPPLLLSFGAPKRRPGHPFSRKKGGGQRSIPSSADLPDSLQFFGARAGVPSPRGLLGHPSLPVQGMGQRPVAMGIWVPRGLENRGPQLAQEGPGAGTRPAVSYLRGSCREGRRGSATIPGLNVLPLSPYPSIQLGLLPLASPWKKFRRKRRKKKINHAAEKRQPYSAGGSSEPGGPVHLRHGRPVSPTPNPAARPRPRHPSFASPPMSQPPRAPPP